MRRLISAPILALLTIRALAQAVPYAPPSASAPTLSRIPFDRAQGTGEEFRKHFDLCDAQDICLGKKLSCSTDKSNNIALMKLPGNVIFYEAKMAVDLDGSRVAKVLYEQRKQAGKAVIDQPETSLLLFRRNQSGCRQGALCCCSRGAFRLTLGVGKGDVVAVVYKDILAFGLVGDIGPVCKIGEGSLYLHEQLGHKVCLKRDGRGTCSRVADQSLKKGVLYLVFAGSGHRILPGLTLANLIQRVDTVGQRLLEALKQSAPKWPRDQADSPSTETSRGRKRKKHIICDRIASNYESRVLRSQAQVLRDKIEINCAIF